MIHNFDLLSDSVNRYLTQLKLDKREPHGLYAPIDYVLQPGGKRLRPVLLLMACNFFDDRIAHAMLPAVAVEIFHNFTLLHDDMMDKADVRRNRPTVHRQWSENTAILSGDAMHALAFNLLCRSKRDVMPKLLDVFSLTALEVCEGQQLDMDFESRDDVTLAEYLEMIRLKTAVLLAASLKMGAICGHADKSSQESLYQFGIYLGLAFQILDDWLDVYSDPKVFGKAIGGDILEAKKTFLLLSALEHANPATRQQLLGLLKDNTLPDKEKIAAVTDIYNRLNISAIVGSTINRYYREAMKRLDEVQVEKERKTELEAVAAKLSKRNK